MTRRARTGRHDAPAQPITEHALSRTFHIQCGARRGTCFSIDIEQRQYLVTAAHLLRGLKDGAVVEILHAGKWKPLDVQVVGVGPPQVDIAVLALKFRIALAESALAASAGGLALGQDAFCLGFPYGERMGVGMQAQRFPSPFVKKVCVAALPDPGSAVKCLYLAGQPNPGFSGGPVVFRAPGSGELRVAAVVSTYQYETEAVYTGTDSLHLSAQHNPDVIVCYEIKHALDLISLNPSGFPLSSR